MKRIALLSIVASVSLFAGDVAPLKEFGPPKPITPNIAQSYMIENQFDRNDRTRYFFVTDKIDESMDKVHLSAGFYDKSFYGSALFKQRGGNFYTIGNLNYTKANSYKDGDGNKVDFGYKRFNQALILGYLPDDESEIRYTLIHDNIKDDKQPNYQMDPVKTDRLINKFDLRLGDSDDANTFKFGYTNKHVQRRANNFDLRDTPMMKRGYLKVDRKKHEFITSYDYKDEVIENTLGFEFILDKHMAKRFKKTPKKDILNAYRFADIRGKTYRIFDSFIYKFDDVNSVILDLEYVKNSMKLKKFDEKLPKPPMMGGGFFPNQKMLFKKFYGIDFNGKVDKDFFNIKLAYDYKDDNNHFNARIGKESILAGNGERFAALFGMAPGTFFVTNPLLDPETHKYIKLSFETKNNNYKGYLNSYVGDGFKIGGYLMVDEVDDLVVFDRARGQKGVLMKDGSIISRNVDARIYSANLFARYNFLTNYAISADLFYKYGENKTDSRALYQIRPFEANLNLDYRDFATFGSYNLGVGLRYVAKQNRGDFDKKTGLGIDLKDASKAFTTLDVYGGLNFKDNFGIRYGVNNVFDKKYADFILGDHVHALEQNLVNAPGRTFWLSIHKSF